MLERLTAQIGGAHGFVGGDCVGRSVCDHAARVEHDDPVCKATDDAEVLLRRRAARALGREQDKAGIGSPACPRLSDAPPSGSSTGGEHQ